jgi:acylphosphatase
MGTKDFKSIQKRAEIIAKGDVQRVGYRDVVERIARKSGIRGFVENLKPYAVKIIAEGEEENLKKFIDKIKIEQHSIVVEELIVEFKPSTGEFEYFEIKRGDWQEEMGERFDVAGVMLHESVSRQRKSLNELKGIKVTQEGMDNKLGSMDNKLGSMDNKLDGMDNKLDKVVDNTGEIKDNTSRFEAMYHQIQRI